MSGLGAVVRIDKVPPIQGVLELIGLGHLPGAVERNRAYIEQFVDFQDAGVADARTLLFDPQTSGGLLVACDAASLDAVLAVFGRHGFADAAVVGCITAGSGVARVRVV